MKAADDPLTRRVDLVSRWLFAALAVFCLAMAATLLFTGGSLALGLSLAVQGGLWLYFERLRHIWVRLGYRRGRWDAIGTAQEARARGMQLQDWILLETVRSLELPGYLPEQD